MEGWKGGDGRMEGWEEMEGWKDGRRWKDGRMEGWKDGRMEGWEDGWMNPLIKALIAANGLDVCGPSQP